MKRILILFIWVAAAGLPVLNADAQQKPHYTQYILNQYIINPAISGIENYVDVKASHRHQWVGLQDAPVTTYFTIHGPIGKSSSRTTATSFDMPGRNPRGEKYWEQYTAPEPHHGIGAQLVNDVTGPLSHFSVYATYAYHLALSSRTSISAGFGAGITKFSLNAARLNFANPIDPAVANSNVINTLHPDINAGLYVYSADYFIGVSAQQVLPSKIEFADNTVKTTSGKFVPHLFGIAGYRFLLGNNFNFIPSLMVKYVNPLPVQYEANLKLQYSDLLWLGAGYRYQDGFSGFAGVNLGNFIQLSYAYDYTSSNLINYTKGTHEVLVGFIIGNKYSDTCPRALW